MVSEQRPGRMRDPWTGCTCTCTYTSAWRYEAPVVKCLKRLGSRLGLVTLHCCNVE